MLHSLPTYIPLSSSGPEHARIFNVKLELSDGRIFTAAGSSLKRAEQEAARIALKALTEEH
jgi:ribonuclease-3